MTSNDNCEHSYIQDYIDLTPERSQIITYCKYCMTTAPDDYELPICESEPDKLPPLVNNAFFKSGVKQSEPLEFDKPLLPLKHLELPSKSINKSILGSVAEGFG